MPVLAIAVHYGFALELGPGGLAWGAALSAAAGFGLLADAAGRRRCWLRSRASCACCSRAAGSRATSGGSGAPIRTRGPLTYAGPGSLGGTESALRR